MKTSCFAFFICVIAALGSTLGVPIEYPSIQAALNASNQGDEVGDNVDFDPWYHDTLFFSASPEPRPPLPESASILAYPNPFNSVATIKLTVPRAMIARIELFNVTGRRVKELWSGAIADTKTVTWQADEFASGLYFVRAWDPLGNRPLALAKVVLLK